MASKFEILFSIRLSHGYFPGEVPVGFSFVPDEATRHLLLRLGLVFRVQADRLSVFYDTHFAGRPHQRQQILSNDEVLVFHLANSDTSFLNYTEGIAVDNISKYLFLFSNEVEKGALRATLQSDEYVTSAELKLVDQPLFSKPFGQIRIKLHQDLPNTFNIRFQAKSTYWRYILTSEHLKSLVNPAVVHKETRQAFAGPEIMILPDQREAIVFRSMQPVQMTALPNKSFQLLENYEPSSGKGRVIIGMMPNPSGTMISALPSSESESFNYSEIFL